MMRQAKVEDLLPGHVYVHGQLKRCKHGADVLVNSPASSSLPASSSSRIGASLQAAPASAQVLEPPIRHGGWLSMAKRTQIYASSWNIPLDPSRVGRYV